MKRIRARLRIILPILLLQVCAGSTFYSLAAAQGLESVEKTYCAQSTGYESDDAMRVDLELNAKRLAVNEIFGELIASFTAVENAVVARDQIAASSVGLIRLSGNTRFFNGENLGEACATIHGYATEEDRAKFRQVQITNRLCGENPGQMPYPILEESVRKQTITLALLNYRPALKGTVDGETLLQLMRRIEVTERTLTENGTLCIAFTGWVVPIEIDALVAASSQTATGSTASAASAPILVPLPVVTEAIPTSNVVPMPNASPGMRQNSPSLEIPREGIIFLNDAATVRSRIAEWFEGLPLWVRLTLYCLTLFVVAPIGIGILMGVVNR